MGVMEVIAMAIDTSAWNEPQLDPLSPPPEDFDGLGVEEAVKLIKQWFFTNFEDPVHNTPHADGSEGGYQYIWGGPYDTDDVIRNVFADVASDETINAAIEAIQNDGFLWVPNERRIQPPDDWVVPNHPHGIFMDSYQHAGDILAAHGGDDGSDLINRMLFVQQVSALEAYLCDTLLKAKDNKESMKRLVVCDRYLRTEKYTLADIICNPDLVAETVRAYLHSLVYHDLKRVNFLYRKALGVQVLREGADNSKLFKAITYRHDCVHRNGLTKDGIPLTVFTKSYVQEIADVVRSLVDQIEREIDGEPF
jgi:hypothetical protein